MAGERGQIDTEGGGGANMAVANGKLANGNGFVAEARNRSSMEVFRTYKRRKAVQSVKPGIQEANKLTEELPAMVSNGDACVQKRVDSRRDPALLSGCDDGSVKNWRKIALQQVFQSLECEDGLGSCTQDVLEHQSKSGYIATTKESYQSSKDDSECNTPGGLSDGIKKSSNEKGHNLSHRSPKVPNTSSVAGLWQQSFFDIITSEEFSQLCSILFENFEFIKPEKLFDIRLINSRMKDGVYESSPRLFYSDIEQHWSKLQMVGSEIINLLKNLSKRSRTSYHEKFPTEESDMPAKTEVSEECGVYKFHSCKRCGEKTDGRNCLVCDSCEEMYHVSCFEPAVKEIPTRSLHCNECAAKGTGSPHDNCVVCERLYLASVPQHEAEELTDDDTMQLDEHSIDSDDDELKLFKEGRRLPLCNICKSEVRNCEKFRICGHPFCSHKVYHERCLTIKQLTSYGPRWYCPSCLCRACLSDCDDHKVVLCDGCDQAYHIYCMQPPRTSIPRGKWFCTKCDEYIGRIREARRRYEKLQNDLKTRIECNSSRKNPKNKWDKVEEGLNRSGGVDMLLSAAKTLNYEENLAANGAKN